MEDKYVPIQKFLKEAEAYLDKKPGVRYVRESYIESEGKFIMLDFVIVQNDEILAVFEFKAGATEIKPRDFYEATPPLNMSFKYLVISTGSQHKVLDRYSDEVAEYHSSKSLLDSLFELLPAAKRKQEIENIAATIEHVVLNFLHSSEIKPHPLEALKTKLANHFSKEKIQKHLRYNSDGQFFHFTGDLRDLETFENTFFRLLTEEVKTDEFIYRYTTLDTVFSTIKYTSIRLNGIVGMNDTSEVGYVESYLDNGFVPMDNITDVEQINNRFIFCSSVLRDDLMQWRLYGDDCKGACLKFRVKKSSLLSGLQLRKISYGIEKDGKNYHPELVLVAEIIKAVKELHKQSVQFRALGIWKHFFKSFEYSPEKEVRLLLIRTNTESIKGERLVDEQPHSIKKDWCLTTSHQIINPFVTIALDDDAIPFELKEIMLGPKCPEIIANKKQFTQLLRERNLDNVTTEISRIKNYR